MAHRIARNFAAGKPSYGVIAKGAPGTIDHMAVAGVDYVIIDQMFSRVDWDVASHLIRGCKANDMTSFIRVQAYPWVGEDIDYRTVVDAARALSLGADGVCVSVRSAAEVREIVKVAGDWHRGLPIPTAKKLAEHEAEVKENTWIMPLLETKQAIAEYEEVIKIPGVKAIWPGMTDLSEALGHPFDYEHPEVTGWLDKVCDVAHKHGVAVLANDGFIYHTPEAKAKRLAEMRAKGVDMLHMQTTDFLAYLSAKNTIDATNALVGNTAG